VQGTIHIGDATCLVKVAESSWKRTIQSTLDFFSLRHEQEFFRSLTPMERKVQYFMDTSAETWDLTGCSIGEVEIGPLAAAVAGSETIRCLNLTRNRITPPAVPMLAAALGGCPRLTVLHLTLNALGDEGAQLLAKAVAAHPSLIRLSLGSNQIGDVGAKALGDMLKENGALRVLNLFGNGISNIGGKALADGLKANTRLQALFLGSTRITDPGVRAFSDALRSNTTLLILCLRVIDNALKADVTRRLEHNRRLLGFETDKSALESLGVFGSDP